MFSRSSTLAQSDPELWQAIAAENRRQEEQLLVTVPGPEEEPEPES